MSFHVFRTSVETSLLFRLHIEAFWRQLFFFAVVCYLVSKFFHYMATCHGYLRNFGTSKLLWISSLHSGRRAAQADESML